MRCSLHIAAYLFCLFRGSCTLVLPFSRYVAPPPFPFYIYYIYMGIFRSHNTHIAGTDY